MRDTIYRDEAIEAARLETGKLGRGLLGKGDILDIISALPSAEAEPTVIRSRTFMPTKDFKEWAKRIREVNPNAVVIPCDAEVVSAEAVEGYTEWLEKIIVKEAIVWPCLDDTYKEWCDDNCRYSSIQAECLRHLYEVSKGGDTE